MEFRILNRGHVKRGTKRDGNNALCNWREAHLVSRIRVYTRDAEY